MFLLDLNGIGEQLDTEISNLELSVLCANWKEVYKVNTKLHLIEKKTLSYLEIPNGMISFQ